MNDLELIKGIINEKFVDTELYRKEADLFEKKVIDGQRISFIFRKFSADENAHILILKKLYKLNNYTIPHRKIIEYKKIRNVLRMHLIRETSSIKLYKKMLTNASGLKEKRYIEAILDSEKNNLITIKKYLFFLK
jgi:hypothetical protein